MTRHRCHWENCIASFKSINGLSKHVKYHGRRADLWCRWEGCHHSKEPFLANVAFYDHLNVHTGRKPYKCREHNCFHKGFATLALRQRHETNHHFINRDNDSLPGDDVITLDIDFGKPVVASTSASVATAAEGATMAAVQFAPPLLRRSGHPSDGSPPLKRPCLSSVSDVAKPPQTVIATRCTVAGKKLVASLRESQGYFNTDRIFKTAFGEPFSLLCRLDQLASGKDQVYRPSPPSLGGRRAPPASNKANRGPPPLRQLGHLPFNPNRRLLPCPPPLKRIPKAVIPKGPSSADFNLQQLFRPPSLSPPLMKLKEEEESVADNHIETVYPESPEEAQNQAVLNRRKSSAKPTKMVPGVKVSLAGFLNNGLNRMEVRKTTNYTIKTEPITDSFRINETVERKPSPELFPVIRPRTAVHSPEEEVKKDRTVAKPLPRDIQDMLYAELHKYGPYQSTNYARLREMTGLYGREITTWFDSRRRALRSRGIIPADADRGGYSADRANMAFLDAYAKGECLCSGRGCYMMLKK